MDMRLPCLYYMLPWLCYTSFPDTYSCRWPVREDVIQLLQFHSGIQYVMAFMDYLTKWPEVFAGVGQSVATIAKCLVKNVVSRHGVPSWVLSDSWPYLLIGPEKEVEAVLGYHKVKPQQTTSKPIDLWSILIAP